jgi:hypothetical protein
LTKRYDKRNKVFIASSEIPANIYFNTIFFLNLTGSWDVSRIRLSPDCLLAAGGRRSHRLRKLMHSDKRFVIPGMRLSGDGLVRKEVLNNLIVAPCHTVHSGAGVQERDKTRVRGVGILSEE